MVRPASPALPEETSRALLRQLRDLNLFAGPIAITPRARVAIAGCLSLDGPAEGGVRYRLRSDDGSEGTLEIRGRASRLAVSANGPAGLPGARRLEVEMTRDR